MIVVHVDGQALARSFVRQVRARMLELGVSRLELAARTGKFPAVVSRELHGHHMPSLETLLAYARALDCALVLKTAPVQLLLVPRQRVPAEVAA